MQWYVNRETITQHYNEQRDLGAKLLSSVCSDVKIEPIHRDILGEQLSRAFNRTPDARLDIHTGGFRKRQCAAFFDMRVRHSNASSYQNKEPQQVSQIHENEKKRQYSRRILDVEKGTFTPWFSQHRVRWGLIDRAHSLKERKAIFHSHLQDKSSCFVFSLAICSCLFKRLQEH